MPALIRTFQSLAEAVDFIAACLEQNNAETLWANLASATVKRDDQAFFFAMRSFRTVAFPDLQERHRTTDLRTLYQGREFPPDEDTLRLGGHFAELGCIHIVFTRQEAGWVLEDILMCR